MSFEINPLHLIDSYKLNHVHMYPEGTDYVYSNFTARSPKHFNNANGTKINFTVFVGLQSMLQELHELWDENFFKLSWEDVEHKYKRRIRGISGKEMDVSHAKRLHEVGFLPIQVMALKEGSLVPIGVPYFTVVTTMPGHGWLTNYLEDVFSNGNWKMINNATTAYIMRKIIDDYAEKTGAVKDMSKWLGHDFSFRGMSTWHDGIRNSFAHLTSFAGSDTVSGIDFAEYYYGADVDTQLVSGSVPASEHSVACSFGQNGEIDYLDQLLKKYPDGIFSIVSDTWDFFNFITVVAMKRKDEIMSRNGKVVFRPDSGDPADILCGIKVQVLGYTGDDFEEWKEWVAEDLDTDFRVDFESESPYHSISGVYTFKGKHYEVVYEPDLNRHDKKYYYVDNWGTTLDKCTFKEIILSPEQKGAVQLLWEQFGGTINEKGYKTLDSHVGLIYGDSISIKKMDEILRRLKDKGFTSDNVVFGIGSYTYNMHSRDTFGMAMKATYVEIDGVGYAIQKDPATGDGTKKSAKGLLNVFKEDGEYVLYDHQAELSVDSELKLVYINGCFLNKVSLEDIRKNLHGDNF
mgnify:CR=1 FL=1